MVLLVVGVVLLVVNAFVSVAPTMLVFAPVFLPIIARLNVSPVRFNVIVMLGVYVNVYAPPMNDILFINYDMSGLPVGGVVGPVLPFCTIVMLILTVIACVPRVDVTLPETLNC